MVETGIFAKIDWFSAVFESCSINDVLKYIGMEEEQDEFFGNAFSRALGYDTQVTYAFDGVSIAVSYSLVNHFALNLEDNTVFDFVFDRLRLDISGTGLDNLRCKWVEAGCSLDTFDTHLRTEQVLERGQMHVTRCDFAFDLIDYKPEFLDTIIEFLSDCPSTRAPIMHLNGGLKYSVRTGDQKTVYLGSPRSDRMLRIYDKKMQSCDVHGCWIKNMEYAGADSWIRIELQTRNKIAHGLCFGDGGMFSIFRYIYENFCFRDYNIHRNNATPVAFWDDLFDWDAIPPIIQNLHFVTSVSTIERAEKYVFGTAFKSILVLIAAYNKSGFLSKIDDFVEIMQSSDDFNLNKKYRSLLFKLHSASEGKGIASLPGVEISDNCIRFL